MRRLLPTVLTMAMLAAPAPAQDPPDPARELLAKVRDLEGRVRELIRTYTVTVTSTGLKLEAKVEGDALIEKPLKLTIEVSGGAPPYALQVSEGGTVRALGVLDQDGGSLTLEVPGRDAPGDAVYEILVEDSTGAEGRSSLPVTYRPFPRRDLTAGPAAGGQVGFDAATMWQRAKRRLADLYMGYVTKDMFAVMNQFSKSMTSPTQAIIRNAVLDDFRRENQTNLELELNSYQRSADGLCARMRWNRNTVRDGATLVNRGNTYVCFSREDEMRISMMQGSIPFGLFDPDLRRQAAGGQPNPDPDSDIPFIAQPEDVDLAEVAVVHAFFLEPVAGDNTLFLDVDGKSFRTTRHVPPPTAADALPSEDIMMYLGPAPPASHTPVITGLGGTVVGQCNVLVVPLPPGPEGMPAAIGSVDSIALAPTTFVDVLDFSRDPIFSYRTPSGFFGAAFFDGATLLAINRDDDPLLDPAKPTVCP